MQVKQLSGEAARLSDERDTLDAQVAHLVRDMEAMATELEVKETEIRAAKVGPWSRFDRMVPAPFFIRDVHLGGEPQCCYALVQHCAIPACVLVGWSA